MRVAIVEDDHQFAGSLSQVLERSEDFELLWHSESAEQCLESFRQESVRPDIVVVDLGLPGMSGAELIVVLKSEHPELRCIAHTVFDEPPTVLKALRAGADGYLLKGCTGIEFLRSLRSLAEGGAPLTPRVARFLVSQFQTQEPSPLTPREGEVLECLSQGFSYQQCADELVVSVHTVHSHVKKIYEKLAVAGRHQAVEKARKRGWL